MCDQSLQGPIFNAYLKDGQPMKIQKMIVYNLHESLIEKYLNHKNKFFFPTSDGYLNFNETIN